MAILSKLKLSNKTRSGMLTSTVTHRRGKLLDAIDNQIRAAHAEQNGKLFTVTKPKRITDPNTGERVVRDLRVSLKKWWWKDIAGTTFLTVRYGNRKLDLNGGMHTIEVSDVDNLVPTLELLADAVKHGELDDAIDVAIRGKHRSNVLKFRA